MNYELEIKEPAKTALRKAPEEIRREIGYRLHLFAAGICRRREETQRQRERVSFACRELSRVV
jgi:phage-related protein